MFKTRAKMCIKKVNKLNFVHSEYWICIVWLKAHRVHCSLTDIWIQFNIGTNTNHPLRTLMDDLICVCLSFYVSGIDRACWFKVHLWLLKCCHIYQSACVGGAVSISLSRFNSSSWIIWIGKNQCPSSERLKTTSEIEFQRPVKSSSGSYFIKNLKAKDKC